MPQMKKGSGGCRVKSGVWGFEARDGGHSGGGGHDVRVHTANTASHGDHGGKIKSSAEHAEKAEKRKASTDYTD